MSEDKRDRGKRADEDTQAILDRRRFLIESALLGAGLGALAAGCAEPRPCLKALPPPRPCLSPPPPPPQPCLKIVPPKPQPCLEFVPPPKP